MQALWNCTGGNLQSMIKNILYYWYRSAKLKFYILSCINAYSATTTEKVQT